MKKQNYFGLTKYELGIVFRTGNRFIEMIVQTALDPFGDHRSCRLLYNFATWAFALPAAIREYFERTLDEAIDVAYYHHTKPRLRGLDGVLYSRSEIIYLTICN